MTREQIEYFALRFEALNDWESARELRALKLSGRSKETRPNGFTPRINALADLHFAILDTGGDYMAFVEDDRIADVEDKAGFLFKVFKPREWPELRKCIAARKVADSNI